MIKKTLTGILAGTAMLSMAAAASADTVEVNIYGASAQYKFWTAAAPEFLEDAGCKATDIYVAESTTLGDRDTGVSVCAGPDVAGLYGFSAYVEDTTSIGMDVTDVNDTTTTENTVIIRYTTNASYDGVLGIQDIDTYSPDSASCTTAGERLMANITDMSGYWGDVAAPGAIQSLSCQDVIIGASDVAAETFNQSSSGEALGPLGDTNTTDDDISRSFSGLTIDTTNTYDADRPVVVPFAFFANNDAPFDNMTRLMATNIFSGKVTDWNQFDTTLTSEPMVVCLRHAGSGTHATLDAAVMRGDATLPTSEIPNDDFSVTMGWAPTVWFNKGSSDEMRCVNYYDGAVGYADADKNVDTSTASGLKWDDIKTMTFQGAAPEKSNIVNGVYDFWSAQWLYSKQAGIEDDAVKGLINDLAVYASDAANLPSSKASYWASQDEMNIEKGTDFAYPSF